ncbi:flavin-containing monooxygenase [Colletotrichum incanum]|uniref:Flavin-containing monooxygenase n=1 Tax=Colletotrichum incanum TaxID=1573173 RepID=A0A162PTT8_COLIC|nr:flavin-containing monooxygenase [Colletotrichum incanum]
MTVTTETEQRTRVPVRDLPSWIPTIPPFEGEATLDTAAVAADFLARFSSAVREGDWDVFGALFAEQCFWRDSLTLTFDKRTLHTRDGVVEAWRTLAGSRRPSGFSKEKDEHMTMDAAWVRMGPTLGTLDVPFSFRTEAPASKCIGQAKLIPTPQGGWTVYILATAVVELEEKPFGPLPRTSPSLIDASQRGKSEAQGLPRIKDGAVLDAVIVGGSCNGIANAIRLDAGGADFVVFDTEARAGGNWSTKRYESVMLHHPAFMIQLPRFPVPKEGYPDFLTGGDLTRYVSSAVEELRLPFFGGVEVTSNVWDEGRKLWSVTARDVSTGEVMKLEARNLVLSTGFLVGNENPKVPALKGRELFKGPVQHTTEFRNPEGYRGKRILVVGSGNSAHDVAGTLALDPEVTSVTLLQRSPTVLMDFENVEPIITMRYRGDVPVGTADFVEGAMPVGVLRDVSRAVMGGIIAATEERCKALEGVGYLVDREPCLITRLYEEKGRSFYIDHPKTFDLVFGGKIKVARGEARGLVEDGVVVVDRETGEERVIEADGVVLATGYEIVDLPRRYKETGFVDESTAEKLVNICMFGADKEGEVPGLTTSSGHPHLYFSGVGIVNCRASARLTAIQVLADVTGQFPERYARS